MIFIENKRLTSLFLMLALLLVSSIVLAEPQLTKLSMNPLTTGKFELKFEFNEQITGYTGKLRYRPNQLIVDIEDANSVLKLNPIEINQGGVTSVTSERINEGLRLVIALNQLMPYRIVQEGDLLFVRFGDTASAVQTSDSELALAAAIVQEGSTQAHTTQSPTNKSSSVKKEPQSTPTGYVNSIKSIDFKRGVDGQGKLLVYLDNSSVAADIRRRDKQLIVEFQSTYISDEFLYIMDVVDFATSVEKIETFKEDGKSRFVLNIKDEYNYHYDQLDTLFVVDVSKKQETQKKNVYEGKAISLNFQDIPVRTVLQLIADFNGLNLVITDSVSGNITLRLDDVPWEQALDLILRVRGLGKRMDGNVLMIAPAAELAAKERDQLQGEQEVKDLAPVYSEFIQINYAKVSDIAAILSNGSVSLLSARGAVSIDQRTNTLLLKDTALVIEAVKEMVEVLDIPVRQVIIEARMVTVSDSVGEELGVRWGISSTNGSGVTSGTLEGANSINDINNADAGDADFSNIDDRLNVNLPIADAAGSIAFQVLKDGGDILDLELSALESENKAEIIASPRITTANQQTAYIEQGTEVPYVESSSSGATSVSFKKAVLSLEVTPQITPDNKVILDLVITQDTLGETVSTGTGNVIAIDTQEIGTQVLVDNGETLVLGGIYQQRISTDTEKIPLLGDIPYLGALFRSTNESTTKSELLIFVTPRIVMQTKY